MNLPLRIVRLLGGEQNPNSKPGAFQGSRSDYFDPTAESIVAQACEELRTIRDSSIKDTIRWHIPENRPIRTVPTNSYQPGEKGGLSIQANLSFVWEIQKTAKRGEFAIVGLCSTKVTLVDISKKLSGLEIPVAWTFEMGSDDSPGCHFHTQFDWRAPIRVVCNEDDMHTWPSLDVPRLPSFLITPGDCLDFVLGELFQDGWPKVYEDTDPAQIGRWIGSSKSRIVAILQNTLQAAQGAARISPWIAIKRWYPRDSRFLLT